MLIDWITVTAQIVNFFVLVALLRHFLYGRIVTAMDRREQDFAAREKTAEEKRKEAEQEAEVYSKRQVELERKREELLIRAAEEAENRKKELLQEAREEIDQIRAGWYESLRREKETFLYDLGQRAARDIHAAARRVLKDLADMDLEHQIVRVFIQKISSLDRNASKSIAKSLSKEKTAMVHSAFQIPSELKGAISETLKTNIDSRIETQYEVVPDLIAGIELKLPGYKISWNIESYLADLQASLSRTLEETRAS